MSNDIKCFFGLHHYEVIKEELLRNSYNAIIGTVQICRCTNCGKIKSFTTYTDISYKHRTE